MRVADLPTPALVIDTALLAHNLDAMSASRPGRQLRPHVKATKSTALAVEQVRRGHVGFTCATVREMEGLAAAGLGEDLLLANEVIDPMVLARAAALTDRGARVTVAVDSEATVDAAANAGIAEVVIDVNVGLPRCGCSPADAERLAARANAAGLAVRGVMGYEGLATIASDPVERAVIVADAMSILGAAHGVVGGEIVSAGSTVSYAMNELATEIQAGSYALMDSAFAAFQDLPFLVALTLWTTVISVNDGGYAVCNGGLKSLGMDHGNPTFVDERLTTLIVSDEHITFGFEPTVRPVVGDRVQVLPAHVDPTVAYHERFHLADGAGAGAEIIDTWEIDLRGW